MNYEQAKFEAMQMYSIIFPTEEDFLRYCFFVNGSYDWINGELVAYETDKRPFEVRLAEKQIEDEKYRQELIADREAFWAFCKEQGWEDGEDDNQPIEIEETRKKIYPLSEYSCIMNIPDDVQPDWLDAAERAIAYARTSLETTVRDNAYLWEAQKRIETLKHS